MSAAFNHLTAVQIRKRLDEINHAEASHARRDLDAEVHSAMVTGGDVDALEAVHLESERIARRLRVEKAALTAELSHADAREANAAVSRKICEHKQLAESAPDIAKAVCAAWAPFVKALEAWEAHQAAAAKLTDETYRLTQKANVAMPSLGTFQSSRLCEVAVAAQWLSNRFGSAESEMQVGNRVHGHRID